MSNAMHGAVPASFFPTAKELSSGLQWFKEHPILAAAAATAVSVITYLNTTEGDEGVGVEVDVEVDAGREGSDEAASEKSDLENAASPPERQRRRSSPCHETVAAAEEAASARSPPKRRSSAPTTSTGRVTPPALRKPGSEGKLSPAAVSWVDEHGGSLTQVFEHLTTEDDEDDDVYPDLDRPLRCGNSPTTLPLSHRRPPTPRRQTSQSSDETPSPADTAASTASPSSTVPHWMGSLAHGGVQSPQLPGAGTPTGPFERQTESPQWGWYVAITPPQDLVPGSSSSVSSGIPRAVVVPSSARSILSNRSVGVAGASTAVSSKEPVGAPSPMRRSASGRIKAA